MIKPGIYSNISLSIFRLDNMHFSVGCDIEKIKRFQEVLGNKRFLSRIFTAQELRRSRKTRFPEVYYARKFAGKEAVFKALSALGYKTPMKSIEIYENGKGWDTANVLCGKIDKRYKIFISLSNTKDVAIASSVVMEI